MNLFEIAIELTREYLQMGLLSDIEEPEDLAELYARIYNTIEKEIALG